MVKILNLFAGIGGNRKAWSNHEIISVEINQDLARVYHQFYPEDLIIVDDVYKFLKRNELNKFDFIWASPPCTTHTCMTGANKRLVPDVTGIYGLKLYFDSVYQNAYVIENTQPWYQPLIQPSVKLDRHYFWSNFFIPCGNFAPRREKKYTSLTNPELLKFHNIPNFRLYDKTLRKEVILRNCCHYSIGEHILESYLKKPDLRNSLLVEKGEMTEKTVI